MTHRALAVVLSLLAFAEPAFASDWHTAAAANGRGETMTLQFDRDRSYIFECTADAVAITYTGVTDLLDMHTNTRVGDAPGAPMPDGAAIMALYSGKGDPRFLPAEFLPNPKRGWDLTLRLAKTDKILNGLPKAKMMSLFTTGHTAGIPVDAETRAQFSGFLARCRA